MPVTKVLTVKGLENLKPAPPGQRYSINDALVPGLAVRVTDRGVRSFVMAKRWPGGSPHPTARTLGRVGALELAEAREKARAWLALLSRGVDPKREEERARRDAAEKEANTFDVALKSSSSGTCAVSGRPRRSRPASAATCSRFGKIVR